MRLAVILGLLACLVTPVPGAILPPSTAPRMGGDCVWANGKVYWLLGRSSASYGPDSAGKVYPRDYQAGISIYTPGSGWASSKWDGTGPLGFDPDGDGKCEWDTDVGKTGVWPESNQGFAYDKDGDGVAEIFDVMGGGQGQNQIWCYDPNNGSRGTWTLQSSSPLGPASNPVYVSFRRGAVGLYGTEVYFAAGSWGGKFGSYDLAMGVWQEYDDGPSSNQVGSTVLNGKLYVVGGMADMGTSIWECDLAHPTIRGPVWSNSGAPVASLNTGVAFPEVVAYNGKVYVLGGYKADGTPTNEIQVYAPTTGLVTNGGTLPFSRWGFGACVDPATGTLYVGAGSDGGSDPDNYTGWWKSGPPYYPSRIYSNWWKCDLDDVTPTFTAIASDPAYFPYDDWDPGTDISGTVVGPGSQPVPYAAVGVKVDPSPHGLPNAMADDIMIDAGGHAYGGQYVTADASGHFGPINVPRGTSWYMAAWKDGWAPSTDTFVNVTNNDPITVNPVLAKLAGKNIALHTSDFLASSAEVANPAANAFDGDLRTDKWATTWGPASPALQEYMLLDLDRAGGTSKAISGLTIWWRLDGGAGNEYSVDLMTGGDPLNPLVWANPGTYGATVTTVYSTTGASRLGYWLDLTSGGTTVDPIRLAQGTTARGIRIRLTNYRWPQQYEIRELQVHSATEYGGLVMGHVKDSSGNPIYDAVVQIGGTTGQYMITDSTGYYSFAVDPGTTQELYGDAPGYAGKVESVTIPSDGTPLVHDIVLTANGETVVSNADFEVANGSKPNGWKTQLTDNGDQPIASTNWDYNYDAVTRSTDFNSTPGGGACGRIHTGTPLSDPRPPNVNADQSFTYGMLVPAAPYGPIPVSPAKVYNFYFKTHRSATLDANVYWRLAWLDAGGNRIWSHGLEGGNTPSSNNWEQVSTGAFRELGWATRPTLRVAPPANAAYAQIRLGLNGALYGNNPGLNQEAFFDDVVLDSISH